MTDGSRAERSLAVSDLFEPGWQRALGPAQVTGAAACLRQALRDEADSGCAVHPGPDRVFAAFELTPLDRVRVVIVGQDPYHGPGQATGLAFSVSRGVAIPPSLRNILTELESDVGVARPPHGDLSAWAERGVLLLNTALTVRAGQAASHAQIGWEPLTDAAISSVSEERDGVAFVLWGRHAQRRARLIDPSRHLVLESAHPSPLSVRAGFFGSRPFSRINAWLEERGERPIDWSLPMR